MGSEELGKGLLLDSRGSSSTVIGAEAEPKVTRAGRWVSPLVG